MKSDDAEAHDVMMKVSSTVSDVRPTCIKYDISNLDHRYWGELYGNSKAIACALHVAHSSLDHVDILDGQLRFVSEELILNLNNKLFSS